MFAIANQICSAHRLQSFTQQRPVVGIVIAQEGFVEAATFVAFDDINSLRVATDLA